MAFAKGHKKLGGRPKGGKNKSTLIAREAFQYAFDKMGGAQKLATWGAKNPTEFYKLFARLIPVDVNAKTDGTLTVEIVKFGQGSASE